MENEVCHLKLEDVVPALKRPYDLNNDYIENELVESIKKHGIIQPIVVKQNNDKYEIIDGNRRYYAAIKAGLIKIPALVRNDLDNVDRINLVDNLYNQELSPIEEAKKYKEILETSNMTQEELANSIGKSQSALANKLRLLNLPLEIQESLNNYEISERHARSLLTVKNKEQQLELLKKIKEEKITVRELDSEIKNMSNMFIPEEFSNKNNNLNQNNDINNNQSNMFIPNENNFNNQNNNMFIPQDNVMNNNSNMFIPNNIENNVNEQNMSSPTPIDLPTNNGGMNPFLTSDNYMPPMSNNSENNYDDNNPFSNIRMNTSNMNNDNNMFYMNNNSNEEINSSSDFDINDYKLPEFDNNIENNYVNEVSQNNVEENNAFNPNVVDISNDYKYVEDNPNYVSVDKPEGVSSVDDVINVLRSALDRIKNGRIKVETEEIDFDDNYQITIRIDKKGDFL